MVPIQSVAPAMRGIACLAFASIAVVAGSPAAKAQDCKAKVALTAVADDGADDTAAIEAAMQRATNAGGTLVIPAGTYNMTRATGVMVSLKNSFTVDATGAVFLVGGQQEGDVFSIDTNTDSFRGSACGNTAKADVTWIGGEFDLRGMMVSTSVPINSLDTDQPTSTQATADALSIRGANARSGKRTQKLGAVTVRNLKVTGSDGSWRTAGGDSGLFIGGATSALIEDSQFFGIRDAAIYLSADDKDSAIGGNYTVRRVTVEGSYDGVTSKRGAGNILYENNVITDTVVGLSIKALRDNLHATGVTMTGNDLRRCVRCILVENANDVVIDNNRLYEVGNRVAGDNTPTNARGRQYEGIALEGTQGTIHVRGNVLEGTLDEARAQAVTTWAHVTRDFRGREPGAADKSGNTITGSWDKIEGP